MAIFHVKLIITYQSRGSGVGEEVASEAAGLPLAPGEHTQHLTHWGMLIALWRCCTEAVGYNLFSCLFNAIWKERSFVAKA